MMNVWEDMETIEDRDSNYENNLLKAQEVLDNYERDWGFEDFE